MTQGLCSGTRLLKNLSLAALLENRAWGKQGEEGKQIFGQLARGCVGELSESREGPAYSTYPVRLCALDIQNEADRPKVLGERKKEKDRNGARAWVRNTKKASRAK